MMRKVLIPDTNTIHLSIPDNYIGKEVEILIYTKDEMQELGDVILPKIKNAARFKGVISKEDAEKYRHYLKQVRNELDKEI